MFQALVGEFLDDFIKTNILGNQVSRAQSEKKLRVLFNSNFTLSDHVSLVIKSTRVHAEDLYRIRLL